MKMNQLTLGGQAYARPAAWADKPLVDVDIHCVTPPLEALTEYLEPRWRDYLRESGVGNSSSPLYPRVPGVYLEDGDGDQGRPGSSLEALQAQLLDPWQTRTAILTPMFGFDAFHNDDLAAALCTAANSWLREEWLLKDKRLRGSAWVPLQNMRLAVAEIERIKEFPEFSQIVVPARTRQPLGRRDYWPAYEAMQGSGLRLAVHAGGATGNPVTPVGWPSHYIEDYVGVSQAFQNQMLSMVSEGVFSQFPDLGVAFLESGFTWLPALMWRFDKNWKGLRREVPWVKAYPSDIIRKHFRISTQPLDAPAGSEELAQLIDQIESDELLMFSTDYPHYQFEDADSSVPRLLTDEQLDRVLYKNADEFYNF